MCSRSTPCFPSITPISDGQRAVTDGLFSTILLIVILPLSHSLSYRCRFLNFPQHSFGSGWNNIMREQLIHAYVSNLSRRAFVIPPHIAHDHRPLGGDENMAIPSSAYTYSPLTGTPFPGSRDYGYPDPPDDQVLPRAVSELYYNSVCPEPRRVKLNVSTVCDEMGLDIDKDEVKVIAEAWASKLLAMDDGCVEVINHPLFDYMSVPTPPLLPTLPPSPSPSSLVLFVRL